MRVITGSAKGRRLKGVPGVAVRPTSDRVKEALFSMLGSRFELTGTIMDLYAGTGAMGIEALSRGAARVVFVEHDRLARRVLRANLAACCFTERAEILPVSVRQGLRLLGARGARFDGVLMDPPYGRGLVADTLRQLGRADLLEANAWVVAERHVDDQLEDAYGVLRLTRTRRYGKTGVVLFAVASTIDRVTQS